MQNSLYVNMLLTGVLSRLACYPQPLIRSFLLNHSLVFQPSVKSLVQAWSCSLTVYIYLWHITGIFNRIEEIYCSHMSHTHKWESQETVQASKISLQENEYFSVDEADVPSGAGICEAQSGLLLIHSERL